MAVVSYERGEYYALNGVKAQVGRLALIDSGGNELTSTTASSTTYTLGDIGSPGSDVLTLTSSVQFDISAALAAQSKTATKLRITTSTASGLMFDIDLTSSQLFEVEGTYTLTASTLGVA